MVCRGTGRAPICSAPQLSTGTQDPGPWSQSQPAASMIIPQQMPAVPSCLPLTIRMGLLTLRQSLFQWLSCFGLLEL